LLARAFCPAGARPSGLVLPGILIANSLPITFGSLGVREGVAIFLMGKLGVTPAAAVLMAFTLFVFNTFFPAVLGFLVAASGPPRKENADVASSS